MGLRTRGDRPTHLRAGHPEARDLPACVALVAGALGGTPFGEREGGNRQRWRSFLGRVGRVEVEVTQPRGPEGAPPGGAPPDGADPPFWIVLRPDMGSPRALDRQGCSLIARCLEAEGFALSPLEPEALVEL